MMGSIAARRPKKLSTNVQNSLVNRFLFCRFQTLVSNEARRCLPTWIDVDGGRSWRLPNNG